MDATEDEERQRVFYGHVRETITSLLAVTRLSSSGNMPDTKISLLVLLCLYLLSYSIVVRFKRRKEDSCSGEEDVTVYRITTWLCSFALSISIGSVLLLPMSIISNEILVHYPDSYYVKWLNTSLITGLWNQVFLGYNLCLFLLLPFAYFFTESEGLAGSTRGIMSRVYETVLLLLLLAAMAAGLAGLLSSLLSSHEKPPHHWLSYLPLMYSLVSLLGLVLMALCTPLGLSCLFTVLGRVITKPNLHVGGTEDLERLKLEEAAIQRRLRLKGGGDCGGQRLGEGEERRTLGDIQQQKKELERHLRSSPWERHVLYPVCFLALLAMTLFSLLLVATKILSLLLDTSSTSTHPTLQLGSKSTSHLGALGAISEVFVIIYLMCASVVGLYSSPGLHLLLPKARDTPMTKLIVNCVILLLLSSALPLMASTLGITNFNLLGRFGSLEWLGSFWLVLSYNSLFFAMTVAILLQRVTRAMLREATHLLGATLWHRRSKHSKSPTKMFHND